MSCLFIAPDKILWAAFEDSSIRCWNLQMVRMLLSLLTSKGATPGKTVFTCKHFAWVNQILIDGKILYACNGNITVIFKIPLDPTNPGADYADAEIGRLEGHTERVTAVAVDGEHIFTASFDRSVRIYSKKVRNFIEISLIFHTGLFFCDFY